jgi:hypothetical protein
LGVSLTDEALGFFEVLLIGERGRAGGATISRVTDPLKGWFTDGYSREDLGGLLSLAFCWKSQCQRRLTSQAE